MLSTIGFTRLSNSPPLRMQRAHDYQEDFIWVVMWARRVKGKEWTNKFTQFGTI